MKPPSATDFDPLDLESERPGAFGGRPLFWLAGLLLVVAASIAALALFLRSVERQEEEQRRAADGEWLDQLIRFHFRRLEEDLATLAQQTQGTSPPLRAGLLWRSPGVVSAHGWVAAESQPFLDRWPVFLQTAAAAAPDPAGALAIMLDTTRGLRRAAYAGPLPGADTSTEATLWLAVPLFEHGRFLGDYVAALQLEQALARMIPAWYLNDHTVALVAPVRPGSPDTPSRYRVTVNLPGAPWTLAVEVLRSAPSPAPRAFFGIALACLIGMLFALSMLWQDMARRRRVESQLQAQMALRTAMERSVALGLRVWDLDGRLVYVNQAFCRLVGRTARELLAQADRPATWSTAHAGSGPAAPRPLPADPPMAQELQLRHRDGHPLDLLVHGGPLTTVNGTVIGWIESALDVTERRRIERLAARQHEQLEASGRLIAVGEVASTLAHELNQPLGALSSFANGLLNRLRAGRITLQDIVPVVERMERMADKAGRVIQRVNAFARRQDMTRQPLDLVPFLRRVVGAIPLPEGLQLQLQLPESGPVIPADALLLEHAVHNVVLNATEWAGHGAESPARVRVGLETADPLVGIRIEDSGPGVPDEQHHHIFDAFASLKTGGMGMGLSICRSIIEAHHGRIEVDRSRELKGAQFTLWLPLNP